MRWIGMTTVALAAALGGCAGHQGVIGAPLPYPAGTATAELHDARGAVIGTARASAVTGGIRITITATGLPPGPHGAHVHAVGLCDPPDFASAGPHWNPLGARHGAMNPAGPHMGDLPNLIVGADGRASLGVTIPGATMAGLLDADGSALVIHAGRDDQISEPAGNSGGRIACGVFAPA